jgi:hypothetical protein
MKFEIPTPLKAEHEELHDELRRATKAGGKIGEAATTVAKLMHPHFVKEEEYALPPLGLLTPLSQGRFEVAMGDVLTMTEKLKAELPTMLAEHKQIVTGLGKLVEAAKAEHNTDIVRFAEKLILHAQTEEQVSYPTAILVGEFVKSKLGK